MSRIKVSLKSSRFKINPFQGYGHLGSDFVKTVHDYNRFSNSYWQLSHVGQLQAISLAIGDMNVSTNQLRQCLNHVLSFCQIWDGNGPDEISTASVSASRSWIAHHNRPSGASMNLLKNLLNSQGLSHGTTPQEMSFEREFGFEEEFKKKKKKHWILSFLTSLISLKYSCHYSRGNLNYPISYMYNMTAYNWLNCRHWTNSNATSFLRMLNTRWATKMIMDFL